jgi:hypothetical protein
MDVSPSPPDLESRGIPGFVCTPPEQIGKAGEEAMAAEENGGADRVTIGVCVMEKKVGISPSLVCLIFLVFHVIFRRIAHGAGS